MQQALLLPVRRTIALTGGANFISYTGGGGSLVDELGPGVLARAQSIWVWRDLVGRWRGFFPGSPAFLQEATDLALGDLVFLSMDSAVGWDIAIRRLGGSKEFSMLDKHMAEIEQFMGACGRAAIRTSPNSTRRCMKSRSRSFPSWMSTPTTRRRASWNG